MPEIEFEVWCGTCGNGLCGSTSVTKSNHVHVDACERCVDKATDKGDAAGYDRGFAEGREEGYNTGYADGVEAGKDTII